ncbi:phosphate permease [Ramicandelaber brevisporus]|nr:phosphate permease [Ramicandelaber brevisporus]
MNVNRKIRARHSAALTVGAWVQKNLAHLQQQQQQQNKHHSRLVDLDRKRREALTALDNARFGWFHLQACMVAGIGFLTDAYDLFIINHVALMLGYIYYSHETGDKKNVLPSSTDSMLKASAQIGTLIGQLLFGFLADRVGRKKMYGIELMIMIVGTIGCAFSASTVKGWNVFVFMCIWRVVLGIGVGGDYPLSAIITSEFATTKRRGAMMAAVFAMQGFGILAASLVTIITLFCFKSMIEDDQQSLDYVWRICVGVGAIPALFAVYFRLTIPETPRYTLDIEKDVGQAMLDTNAVTHWSEPVARSSSRYSTVSAGNASRENVLRERKVGWADFKEYFGRWKHGKILLGTAVAWFALDVAFYGINMNTGVILSAIGYSGNAAKDPPFTVLMNSSVGSIIVNLMGLIPGYWVTVFTVDKLGRKTIQIVGFSVIAILLLLLGFTYDLLVKHTMATFIVLFTMVQFFNNFGPNATTFIIPGEVFPTRWRSTGHGISAASGKAGAIASLLGLCRLRNIGGSNEFVKHLFKIYAGFMALGLVFTFLIPETKGKTLEELSGEEQEEFLERQHNLYSYF